MHKLAIPCLMLLASAFNLIPPASSPPSQDQQSHIKWVEASLTEMETIKVGMTRADLLKVFMEEGGLSTRQSRTYVYRTCPYFKVRVEFKPIGEAQESVESSKDEIVKISQPFLQRMVAD